MATTEPKSRIAQNRYERLVAFAQARGRPLGYAERHHIVPKSAGGTNTVENLVWLTAREHFLAHWLLFRIQRTPAAARAFRLMVNDQTRRRGRDYEDARKTMAEAMRGSLNVAKRPEVRRKLVERVNKPFLGKKRPEHAAHMRALGVFSGNKNPGYKKGARQEGAKNHMARSVVGVHVWWGVSRWETLTDAAKCLGVTVQAVAQAVKRGARSKGWRLEAVA